MDRGKIFDLVKTVMRGRLAEEEKLRFIAKTLYDEIEIFNWVGFYMNHPKKGRMLKLGPFFGAPTDHVEIPYGKGICGQAAQREETFVIQDVTKQNNYLSCSIDVKSEIVVPIFRKGNIAGQLDIDSHKLNPFTPKDRKFLEEICKEISNNLE